MDHCEWPAHFPAKSLNESVLNSFGFFKPHLSCLLHDTCIVPANATVCIKYAFIGRSTSLVYVHAILSSRIDRIAEPCSMDMSR